MQYDWDEAKRRRNLAKHGVDFVAVRLFDWDTAVITPDDRRAYGERRLRAYGYIGARLMVLIYTRRGRTTWLVSLRKANPREVKRYG